MIYFLASFTTRFEYLKALLQIKPISRILSRRTLVKTKQAF